FEDGLTGAEVGMNAADLDGCYELSNSIAVTRNEPIGGTISTTDETTICIDGIGDPIDVSLTGNSGGNSAWVITDESLNILGIPPGPPFDLDGAGPGVCLIWHLSFEDGLTGAEVGMNAADLEGCYELSNSITVTRDIIDGATISLTNGETIYSNCPGNVVFDVQNTSDNVYFDYYYVITNENDVILAWVDAAQTQTLDLSAAPAGECHVWGWNSIGTSTPVMGDHISSLEGESCEELSDNFITVLRTLPDGGYIEFDDGTTSYEGCAGAIDFDLVFSTSTFQNYWFVVTDDNNNILTWFNSDNGGWIDLNGAPPGICRIYGWNEMDLPEPIVGQPISSLSDPMCGDVSENWVTVNRLDCETEMCEVTPAVIYTEANNIENRVVVANRASGTISVINSDTDKVISTHDMPNDGEPMYVVYNSANNTYLVGDYNGYVAAFDAHDFSNTANVKVGDGVFHMWMSPDRNQLWVNNEIDRTISVINPTSLEDIATVELPSDLFDLGYKPHDVILMPNNSAAFVTLLGSQEQDYVIKYSTSTFEETGRVAVGLDPHVSLTSNNDNLYVAAQGSSELNVMKRSDLSLITKVEIPNAHGLGINESGTYLYIGNISEGGTNATYTLDLATNTLIGDPVDAPFSAPHNYAVKGDDKLYITHSGNANNQVSIYDLTPTPVLSSSIEVGNNPFGLVAFSIQNTTEVSICVDGIGDPIDVSVEGGNGMNNAWVITNTEGLILGLPPMGPFDLDGAGTGICLIWYLVYDDIEGLEVGMSANDLEGCFALSNPITVYREAADGGTISLSTGATEGTFCAGDVVFDVTHETTANNLSYWYIITDDNDNILGFHNSEDGPTLDLSVAPAGECHIWGWSYRGEGDPVMGENISTLTDGDCESISSNFIRIIRSDVTAAAISTEDETTICVDGIGDPIDVTVEGGTGSNSAWVITDESGTILGLPPMGPFDLDGAGEGVCLIWYVTFEEISGVEVGLSANDLEGCFALSNPITVTRESANGGTVSLVDGEEEAIFCAGEVVFDVTHTTTAENLSYWYIITDDNDNILGFHNSEDGPTLDLSIAPAGECHIWGWSYRGEGDPVMGENISTLSDGDCESISSNFITITRLAGVEAAAISTEDETTICVDGIGDPIDVTVEGGTGSNSAWVITDESGTILGLPPMGPFDLDGAGEGVCLIWYVTYEEISGVEVGLSANDLEGCFALSNPITVTRQSADGGMVALANGQDTATYCVGEVVFDVMHETTATALGYWYVITDNSDNILAFHNSLDGPTLDLSAAPAGECHIWGWSSNGSATPMMGESISSLQIECGSVSTNFISIFRAEGIDGGTISTESSLVACPNDGNDDIVTISTSGSGEAYAYILTDENDVVMGAPIMDSSINFEEMEPGINRIYGVGYAGTIEIGNTIDEINGSCVALSSNFIEVIVQETVECTVTSTEDLSTQDIKVYPNPSTNFITIEYSTSTESVVINILDSRGQLVLTSEENNGNGVLSIDVQNLLGGMYILQFTTADSAVSKRIIITK
ncbi:MAG: T9SS type A sorting domain-containing protein, partial [Saprospiraceae bacterium]|nr:T9SS type A sorting domain-containing protein [Saprospiraceae bacterium]